MSRARNFTETENQLLLTLVDKYKCTIECKQTDTKTACDKAEAWMKLCEEFNALSTYDKRDAKKLQGVWKNLKARAKANSAFVRRERMKTGGGSPPQLNPDTEKIEAIVPSQIKPLHNMFDDDAELDFTNTPQTEDVITVLLDDIPASSSTSSASTSKRHSSDSLYQSSAKKKRNAITQDDINEMKMTLMNEQLKNIREEHDKKMEVMNLKVKLLQKKLEKYNEEQ